MFKCVASDKVVLCRFTLALPPQGGQSRTQESQAQIVEDDASGLVLQYDWNRFRRELYIKACPSGKLPEDSDMLELHNRLDISPDLSDAGYITSLAHPKEIGEARLEPRPIRQDIETQTSIPGPEYNLKDGANILDLVRELQLDNGRLAMQLGAAMERIRSLENARLLP